MNTATRNPTVRGTMHPRFEEILTPEALRFVAALDDAFAGRRAELLQARRLRSREISNGANLDFLPETEQIRADDSWQVAPPGPGLEDRRCELVAPANRKMAVHALNSGANIWLADLEDATAPSWQNVIEGQLNLYDAVRGTLTYDEADGARLSVGDHRPTLVMRPRGWHLCEKHIVLDGRPFSASLVDFGLYFFHNAQRLIDLGHGPYFYLPKVESHLEARLWNDVFELAQQLLGIPQGTIRATVLIETITAAFEMDEILYELREHCSGLNAGRWDYIFSYVRTFAHRGEEFVLPDRDKVTMTTPFMRAYTQLLVDTCHKRGAHAIGGPAAVNPTRQDEESRHRALGLVRSEKEREAAEGFDGSWVAHPALVEICQTAYASVLGTRHDQRDVRRAIDVTAADLVSLNGTQQTITLQGVRTNVSVALRYLAAWIGGRGAVAIDNLMEDAATVEISRAQLWQWLFHNSQLAEGPQVTRDLLDRIVDEELAKLTRGLDDRHSKRYEQARQILEETAFGDYLPGFFTPYAYVRYLIDRPLRMSGPLSKEDVRQSEQVAAARTNGTAA
ncbi:malate synthase A [Calidifontibacter sp. DB0510]|uniref:Malate synthase n=1 Tax=Metallococcus carri TaxID=1656884 RepID=A0A967AX92_9MICO|nr:malate synthase A [Metallococcus carri]NHN54398.1 malate synthase A [Metallococcus carri]NOP36763.1 malate synthase A [Calidifontibacter sp. DB2511S]